MQVEHTLRLPSGCHQGELPKGVRPTWAHLLAAPPASSERTPASIPTNNQTSSAARRQQSTHPGESTRLRRPRAPSGPAPHPQCPGSPPNERWPGPAPAAGPPSTSPCGARHKGGRISSSAEPRCWHLTTAPALQAQGLRPGTNARQLGAHSVPIPSICCDVAPASVPAWMCIWAHASVPLICTHLRSSISAVMPCAERECRITAEIDIDPEVSHSSCRRLAGPGRQGYAAAQHSTAQHTAAPTSSRHRCCSASFSLRSSASSSSLQGLRQNCGATTSSSPCSDAAQGWPDPPAQRGGAKPKEAAPQRLSHGTAWFVLKQGLT